MPGAPFAALTSYITARRLITERMPQTIGRHTRSIFLDAAMVCRNSEWYAVFVRQEPLQR
jgi:hypothetical protein